VLDSPDRAYVVRSQCPTHRPSTIWDAQPLANMPYGPCARLQDHIKIPVVRWQVFALAALPALPRVWLKKELVDRQLEGASCLEVRGLR
jgi:hypothetical protein